MKDFLTEGHKVAAKYLDPAVKEAVANGADLRTMLTGALLIACLGYRGIHGGTPAQRKEAFLELVGDIVDQVEEVTKPRN